MSIVLIIMIGVLAGAPLRDYCIMRYTGVPVAAEIQWGEAVTATFDKIERVSSRRLSIWKEYISKWNLLGHYANKRLYVELYGSPQWAHNTFLEITCRTPQVLLFYIGIAPLVFKERMSGRAVCFDI